MNEKVMFCINYVAERALFALAIIAVVAIYFAITSYGSYKLFCYFGHPFLGFISLFACPLIVAHIIMWILDMTDEALEEYKRIKK